MKDVNDLIGKTIEPVPVEPPEIGIDTDNKFIDAILDNVDSGSVDLGALESFSAVSQTREALYRTIDDMALDDRVSAVLETYTEDATETNDNGRVVWCESSDSEVANYVTFLLDSLNVDKNAYEWMFSLVKYGDVYLKLYKESDYDNDILFGSKEEKDRTLNEDLLINVTNKSDKYVNYVKMVPNPGEMFDLTRFGKTVGYIKAPVAVQSVIDKTNIYNSFLTYKMKKNDVTVYGAGDFVHACLTNSNNSRFPEEISIFKNEEDYTKNENASNYEVRRGQSLLYNQFKVWRELSLLENSVMLNRVVKSAIVRVINVDIGEMPKSQVTNYIQRLKSIIEQKSAISVDKSMTEYNNPGPIENTLYIPTHGNAGAISLSTIGGDFDPKSLTDLDYFLNKFYGGLRVPKQYFGNTDDAAGFNGGSSLSIISARYGKAVKKIQNTFCQFITDLVNIFLLNRGLDRFVNKFTIRMQAPVTQEEIDRRDNVRNKMGIVQDVMSQVGNVIENDTIKLKVLKTLLTSTLADPEVINLLQEQIELLEQGDKEAKPKKGKKEKEDLIDINVEPPMPKEPSLSEEPEEEITIEEPEPEVEEETAEAETIEEPSFIPSPNDLNQNFMDNI